MLQATSESEMSCLDLCGHIHYLTLLSTLIPFRCVHLITLVSLYQTGLISILLFSLYQIVVAHIDFLYVLEKPFVAILPSLNGSLIL